MNTTQRPQINLGDKARDTISGFEGIVVAITNWMNGCQRITIAPQEMKDGQPINSHVFDAEQIEVIVSGPGKIGLDPGEEHSP